MKQQFAKIVLLWVTVVTVFSAFAAPLGCAAEDHEHEPIPMVAPTTVPVSGERLSATFYTADDGAQQWVGWFDNQTAASCSFRMASDGLLRCLPEAPTLAVNYYSDPSCTKPIVVLPPSCEVPTLALVGVGCGLDRAPPVAVHPLDVTPFGGSIYRQNNVLCSLVTGSLSGVPHQLLAAVSPGDFVFADFGVSDE